MRPVLLEWRGFRIHSYPALLYAGMLAGMLAGNWMANRTGLDSGRVLLATLLLLVPALIGSRLLFVASHWEHYRRTPRRIWRGSEGGGAMLGGLVLAGVASVPLLRVVGLPFGTFWDVATFTMIVGLFVARFGCLLHGCCGGRRTDGRVALYLPDRRGVWRRRFPLQLFEAALAVVLLGGALGIWNDSPPGTVFLGTVAVYSLARFALEPLREDRDPLDAVTVTQVIAPTLCIAALVGLWLIPSALAPREAHGRILVDWFVLVTPLALLPILSLLAFVGCALDRGGLLGSISLIYGDGVAAYGAQTIKITISGTIGVDQGTTQVIKSVSEETTISPVHANGGSVEFVVGPGTIDGTVTCVCSITTADGQETVSATQSTVGEELEPFVLDAGPGGLHLGYGFALHGS